jgi:predicted nucleic acid-binding Zn ribbon protein
VKVRRRRKDARPSVQPRPASQLLDGTFRRLKLDEAARSFRAMRAFALAVAANTRIGEHARAERLRGSILYVRCDSSSWTQHLHVMKTQLLECIHKTPGGEEVQELRFNVGPLDEVADWESPARAVVEIEPEAHELPAEVARALGDVTDEELREHLVRLYGKLGATKRSPT